MASRTCSGSALYKAEIVPRSRSFIIPSAFSTFSQRVCWVSTAPISTSSVSPGHQGIVPKWLLRSLIILLHSDELDTDILHLVITGDIEKQRGQTFYHSRYSERSCIIGFDF